jgi:tRNA (guanine37-N1)-methyltransferase
MLWRAQKEKKIKVHFYNPRDYSLDKHKKVDGRPYGGGPGMVMQVEPVIRAISAAQKNIAKLSRSSLKAKNYPSAGGLKLLVLITTPAGKIFDNKLAESYSKKYEHIIIVCGHYEGIDARVKKILKADLARRSGAEVAEISIGPYVLTGGELPALVMIDSIARQIPGVLGNDVSLEEKRVSSSETYTRPEIFKAKDSTGKLKSYSVPKVLLSGHHAKIDKWKLKVKVSK